MNVSRRKNSKLMLAGITGICALEVLLTVAGILSVRRMQNTATMIYEHPYTVSNEARAMRSRLLDMKGFIATLLFLMEPSKYDAILMNVQIPLMNGYQATELILRAECPRSATIPIIAMTADVLHEDMVKAAASGMNAHMAKPIDPEQLYHLLKKKILKE